MNDPVKSGIQYAIVFGAVTAGLLSAITIVRTMDHPRPVGVQRGYRGTGLDQIYSPSKLAELVSKNQIPYILPPVSGEGLKAGEALENVRVEKDISVIQLTRLMASMTTWVVPEQGCDYCHNADDMGLDTQYPKVVARRMLQMTQYINSTWKSHVHNTGVTCYTCHRGNPVPQYIWFNNPGPAVEGLAETQTGMGHPTPQTGSTALPYDPFTPFLEESHNIRVQSTTALHTNDRSTMKQAEWTYALMLVITKSLGVNCDYCHNTRAFGDWSQSTPARVTAWYGIRMVRDLNTIFLDPLKNVFPAARRGPMGDSPKIYCATCHQGVYKPLFGKTMLTTFEKELGGPPATLAPLLAPYVPPPPSAGPDNSAPAQPAAPPSSTPPAPPAPSPATPPK